MPIPTFNNIFNLLILGLKFNQESAMYIEELKAHNNTISHL